MHQVIQIALCFNHMFPAMEKSSKLGIVALMADEGVSLKYGLQSFAGVFASVTDLGEVREMSCHMAFMPGCQDGLYLREIFV